MPDVSSTAPADVDQWIVFDVHKNSLVAAALPASGGTPQVSRLENTTGCARPLRPSAAQPGEEPFLPRAHRAISNLKAWMHGTHRGVGDPHLQVYLDEYVFRHNPRRTPMAAFQTLLGLGALHGPTTYDQITRRAA